MLSGGSGPLILTGGTDISTGLSFTGELEAPEGSAVVTPLTTVVEKLIETSGDTVSQADNAVIAALGLPASIDLTTLDAVAGAQSGDPAALSVFETGSELLDVITLIQAAGGSADAAYAALAADITADVADGQPSILPMRRLSKRSASRLDWIWLQRKWSHPSPPRPMRPSSNSSPVPVLLCRPS